MKKIIVILIMSCTLFSCKKEVFVAYGEGLDDWTTETHTANVSPNYSVVFDQSQVNRIDLVFDTKNWNLMQNDLSDVLGSSSSVPGGEEDFSDQTPIYVECELFFNDIEWYHVGVRYKGNSSLAASSGKLPLRLNFDEFEDTYVNITNQRFYGFKELSLGSNYNDEAVMRDKTASDLFRDFGVPAVQTAFYEIWIDDGSGTAEYYGVYTMNEVVFDSFLSDYFGSETGNCYKPEGDGAAFAESGFNLADFELKNNDGGSKSDIQEMYDILHDDSRTSNPSQWRADLETVFDVDGFLKYLAVNNTIQNWDTYGNMTHNYYLYHDPADDLIKWIVWDNNEAFNSGSGTRSALSLSMSSVDDDWPLISFIIDQSEYKSTYKSYLNSFINSSFEYNRMDAIYTAQEALLLDAVTAERSGYTYVYGVGNFTAGVYSLKSHCSSRISAVESYL